MTSAFYAGSFDPLTNGHLWMIEEAAKLFDKVVVGVATNPAKKPTISIEERKGLLDQVISNQSLSETVSTVIVEGTELSVQVAQKAGCQYFIRGLRNAPDFEYEMQIIAFNLIIVLEVKTIFLPTPKHLGHVSSSLVKSLIGLQEWETIVAEMVPSPVLTYLKKQYAERRQEKVTRL